MPTSPLKTTKTAQNKGVQFKDKDLIDEVTYLASLVSDPRGIDPLLDKLRIITANIQQTTEGALTNQEHADLWRVDQQIRDYLIQNDPLRSFTSESLQRHLDNRGIQKRYLLAWPRSGDEQLKLIILILIIGVLFVLPLPLVIRIQLSMPVFMIGIHLWITRFFWLARRDFRSKLRQAYVYICIGVLMTGLTITQYPLAGAFELLDSPLYIVGGFTPGFAIAFSMMYLGLCLFARVLVLRTILTSVWWIGGTMSAVLLAVIFLPNPVQSEYPFLVDLSVAGSVICAVFALYGALLARRIAQHTTILYAHGMNLFATTLYMVTLGSLLYAGIVFVTGNLLGLSSIIAMTPFIVSEFFMLRAGYTFYRTS